MSALLQSGHHPDADQLSAFVEHALPAHEHQETLAHLAVCADCRAVVALSLPPLEETMPQPGLTRRPRLSGWRLLWPLTATAALAALVAAAIHMRNVSIAPIVPAAPQLAVNHTPPPPAQPPAGSHAQKPPAATSHAASTPVTANPVRPESPSALPLQGRAVAPSPAAAASAPAIAAAAGGVASADGAGITLDQAAAAPPLPQSQSQNQPQSLRQTPPQSATVFNFAQSPSPAAASETMNGPVALLQSTPTLQAVAVPDLAQAVILSHPLPSGLPTLSIVTNALRNQTLAVDIHGALFLTADSGEHWTSVASPWPGRAVKVDLTYSGHVQPAGFLGLSAAKRSSQFAPAAGSIGGPVRISSGVVLSSLSGTITDTTGATVPGATVIVSTSPTQLALMTTTDATGHYVVDNLVPGTYSIEADYPGFNRQQMTGVAVTPGKPSTANLALPVAATTQTVEVTSAAEQIVLPKPEGKMKAAAAKAPAPPQPVFEITTDTGQHWVSADGVIWQPKTD